MDDVKPRPLARLATVGLLALACSACALWLRTTSLAQSELARDAQYYRRQATKAYKEKDYPVSLDNLNPAQELREPVILKVRL